VNKLDDTSASAQLQITEQLDSFTTQMSESTLRKAVEKALRRYFQHLEDEPVTNLYQMVISEVEAPLLEAVMRYTGNNQSKASIMLGLNRGTLRSKLKQFNLL
jgi:Fis family transcriptional regulator|tara:strand:- start:421 stop:729 length:309 start_codon:yes stop_codon:yes gene_type:complete